VKDLMLIYETFLEEELLEDGTMFRWLARNHKNHLSILNKDPKSHWELIPEDNNTLIIRFLTERLCFDDLRDLIGNLRTSKFGVFVHIYFDFTLVQEFVGPWGIHFALLIGLARNIPVRINMIGLPGKPAALAWLFRGSPEVRDLLAKRLSGSKGTPDVFTSLQVA
jgi:hypothetical protein